MPSRHLALLSILLVGCVQSPDTDEDDPDTVDTGEVDDDTPPVRDATVARDATTIVRDATAPHDAGTKNDAQLPIVDATVVADASPRDAEVATDAALPSLCSLEPYQVGLLGDSYIDLSGDVTKFLQEDARKAGALGASETYIDKSKSGAAMQKDNLLAPAIPTQLPTLLSDSKRLGPKGVKLVVMTGGGNDVLIDASQCKTITTPTEECKTVVTKSLKVIEKLFADMKKAGIEHVIYFWYPDLGPSGGKVINDYSIPLAREQCEQSPDVTCHFVDTREPFRGHPEYISPLDGIHPTSAGSKVIADLVWKVMVDNCLGSKP